MPITNNVPGASIQGRYYSFFIQLETYICLSTYLRYLNVLSESARYYAFTPNCFWRIYITISSKLLRTLNYILFCRNRQTVYLNNSVTLCVVLFQFRNADATMSIEFYEFFKSDIIDESYISRFYFVSKK